MKHAQPWLQAAFFIVVVKPFLLLMLGVRVRGAHNIPRRGPFVLIANHSSHLDVVCLMSLLPLRRLRDVRPVAAADYFTANRFRAWFAATFIHILPISRFHVSRNDNPVEHMLRRLAQGQPLILFPEGTRSIDGELGRFHSGIARIARRMPEVPIVPVYLENLDRALPKGKLLPLPIFCSVNVGAPVRPTGHPRAMMNQIENSVRDQMPATCP